MGTARHTPPGDPSDPEEALRERGGRDARRSAMISTGGTANKSLENRPGTVRGAP